MQTKNREKEFQLEVVLFHPKLFQQLLVSSYVFQLQLFQLMCFSRKSVFQPQLLQLLFQLGFTLFQLGVTAAFQHSNSGVCSAKK